MAEKLILRAMGPDRAFPAYMGNDEAGTCMVRVYHAEVGSYYWQLQNTFGIIDTDYYRNHLAERHNIKLEYQ